MPYMDFGSELNNLDFTKPDTILTDWHDGTIRYLRLRLAVESYLYWPDSKEFRDGYMVTARSALSSVVEAREKVIKDLYARESEKWGESKAPAEWSAVRSYLEGINKNVMEPIKAELFTPYGGHGAVGKARGYDQISRDIKKKAPDVRTVGEILGFIISMHFHHNSALRQGASKNKAIDLLDSLNREEGRQPLKDKIKKVVNKNKRAGALYSAYDMLWMKGAAHHHVGNMAEYLSVHLDQLLGCTRETAKFFYAFGQKQTSTKDVHTFSELWEPPLSMGLPSVNLSTLAPVLDADMLSYLDRDRYVQYKFQSTASK